MDVGIKSGRTRRSWMRRKHTSLFHRVDLRTLPKGVPRGCLLNIQMELRQSEGKWMPANARQAAKT
ncbi:hypothetical protein JRQ81_009340 [Phrynocephalus forsythii]|uniref:Uncharacterized protein n=1 Tax=Phrynocephalus forsythii TaxID=171643 RepID=A0A9Q0XA04_9SAUR|nr:hypothetical protein JRQ81_009340 [Phrynocephalus forsythii]